MASHNDLGKKGELLAIKFLQDKNYKIVETNWRFDKDEIDIVAMDGDELVIVEVKTRSNEFYGNPEESVGFKKEKFLIRATESYLVENDLDLETRIDIIAIIVNDKEQKIHHILDAFYPE